MSTKATTKKTNNAQVEEAAAAQEAAAQAAAAANKTEQETEIVSGKIMKVMLPEGNDERITFVLDKEFETYDFKTGELKTTNMFGMNIYAAVAQLGQFIPYIQLADALAMGKMVNPQIISLSTINADVDIKREEHEEGEQRKYGENVYARNCKTSEFVKVKPNINPIFEQTLMQLVNTAPAIIKAPAIPNPFGM